MRHNYKWSSYTEKLKAWLEISEFSYSLLENYLIQKYGNRKANTKLNKMFEQRHEKHLQEIKNIFSKLAKTK